MHINKFLSHEKRRTVLVIDVVESVRLIEQNEQSVILRWLELTEFVKARLVEIGKGRVVKSLGDGMLLQFPDTGSALQVAFAAMDFMGGQNAALEEDSRIHLRMGVEIADVMVGEDDIYGHGVNMAARLATLAKPGEIVVSASVRDDLIPDLDADVEDMGDCFLKHVEEPVRAYRVRPPGHTPVLLTPGSIASMLPTIAVIPFDTNAELDFGEILAAELIRALSQSDRVNVISRLSTRAFRHTGKSAKEIGKLLKANYVMTGTCLQHGERLVVTLELSEAKNSAVVWSDRFVAGTDEILLGDQELVSRIAAETGRAILKREFDRARTLPLPTVESYSLLIGAITSMYRLSRQEFQRAGEMLQHLIDREPRQPLPLAWLGNWHVLRVQQGWTESVHSERLRAQSLTARALDLDSENDQALTIDGLVQTNLLRDFEEAEDRYNRALLTNPNAPLAWLLKGMMHAFRGEGGPAVEYSVRASRLSPIDPQKFFYDSLASGAYISAGEYERAEAAAIRSLKANTTHNSTLRTLAVAQWNIGKHEEARTTVRKLILLDPEFTISRWRTENPSASFEQGARVAEALEAAGAPK